MYVTFLPLLVGFGDVSPWMKALKSFVDASLQGAASSLSAEGAGKRREAYSGPGQGRGGAVQENVHQSGQSPFEPVCLSVCLSVCHFDLEPWRHVNSASLSVFALP